MLFFFSDCVRNTIRNHRELYLVKWAKNLEDQWQLFFFFKFRGTCQLGIN
jgi:hypothetical protein